MPLPEPTTKESSTDFIDRCMGDDLMVEEYPDQKQRAAVCNAQIESKQLATNRNQSGSQKAKQLIREGKIVETRKWSGPSASVENRFIEENGWDKYGEYFLGRDYRHSTETKAHWKYPFTNDFDSVNINGLRAIRTRSAQNREDDIFATAGRLLDEAKKKKEKEQMEALSNLETFNTICFSEKTGNVDREGGVIENISIISAGEAKGHRMMISTKTLDSAITLLMGKTLPAYLSHNGANGDRLLTEAGYFSRFYRDGDQIRAHKFTVLESFKKYEREKFDRLFEIAEVAPESFGVSIVFEGQLFWEMKDGSEESMELGYDAPENARFDFPTVRPLKITSADFVDTPAANGALFSVMGDKSIKGIEMNLTTTESNPIAEPQPEEVVQEALGASNESASSKHESSSQENKPAEPPKPAKKKAKKKALAEQDEEDREDEQRGEEEEIAEKDQGEEEEEEGKKAKEEGEEEGEDAAEQDKFEEPDDEYQDKMRAVVEEIGTHIEEVYNGFGRVMERFDELKKMTGDHRVEEKDEKEMDEMEQLKAKVEALTQLTKGTEPIKQSAPASAPQSKQEIKAQLIEKYLSKHPNSCRSTAVLEVSKTNPELWENQNN